MANDPGPETQVSVSAGEVRVGKRFEAEQFPVPAIAFEIESSADDPVRVRLVDQIPESFAMEGVGFHPDYDSDNWTAYRDHRVAYERTLDPGESVLTVYGIRIDDPEEAAAFLEEPTVELVEPDDTADSAGDVLGRDTTQVVRDALSGEGAGELSDLESESEALLDDEAPEPRPTEEDLADAMGDRDEDVSAVDAADEEESADEAEEAAPSADVAAALDPRSGSRAEAGGEAMDESETAEAGPSAAVATDGAETQSVAAALATEIRAGTVDDDDLEVLQDALEEEVPTSVDVRVSRLQSQVEDLLAYRDALAEFLDENGTAKETLDEVNDEVSDLNARIEELEESISEADADRDDLHDEVTALADTVAGVSDQVESVDDQLSGIETTVENFDERLTTVETFRSELDDIQAELDELQTFRDRLNSAFGPGEE